MAGEARQEPLAATRFTSVIDWRLVEVLTQVEHETMGAVLSFGSLFR